MTEDNATHHRSKLPISAVLRTQTTDERQGFMKTRVSDDDRIYGFTTIGTRPARSSPSRKRRCCRAWPTRACATLFLRTRRWRRRLTRSSRMCRFGPGNNAREKWQVLSKQQQRNRKNGRRERQAWLRERRVHCVDRGNKLRTPITATRASHNREAHARVSDSSVISREGLYESP
jgi:arginyl-tRNA--protein-N-Asp/Glu arginylyltransferase